MNPRLHALALTQQALWATKDTLALIFAPSDADGDAALAEARLDDAFAQRLDDLTDADLAEMASRSVVVGSAAYFSKILDAAGADLREATENARRFIARVTLAPQCEGEVAGV